MTCSATTCLEPRQHNTGALDEHNVRVAVHQDCYMCRARAPVPGHLYIASSDYLLELHGHYIEALTIAVAAACRSSKQLPSCRTARVCREALFI